jgi:hypothetical protein
LGRPGEGIAAAQRPGQQADVFGPDWKSPFAEPSSFGRPAPPQGRQQPPAGGFGSGARADAPADGFGSNAKAPAAEASAFGRPSPALLGEGFARPAGRLQPSQPADGFGSNWKSPFAPPGDGLPAGPRPGTPVAESAGDALG